MASLSKENYNPEEYLLDTLNDLDIGFVKVSNDGTLLNHNLSFNKIFGYNPKKNLIGTKTLDYWLNSEERNKFIEILFKNGIVKKYIAPVKKVDGEKIFIQMNFKLNKNTTGEIISSEGAFVDVTERIRTEQKLKESEEKYRSLFENILEGFAYCKIITDENGIPVDFLYLEINDAFERLTGLKKEETVGKRVSEVIPGIEDSEPNLFEIYGKVALTGENTKFEIYFEPLKIWLSISVYSPKKNYFVAVFDNITERKKSQQKLKESEEKWKALSENSPTHITLLDKEHKILFINHPVPDLSKEELIGTPVYNFVPQEFHQITRDSLNSVWETGEPATYSTNYITKEGDTRFFDVWVGPVFQSDKIVALVAHSMDTTDHKKKEEEIRLQSEIMTNLADGVHLIRVDDGIIVYTNPAFEEMFGYNPGEMIGKDSSIVNAPTDKTPEETKEEIIGILLETGKWHGEVLNIKKDGMTFWCYANVSLFEHPEYGKVIVAVHTDITGRKKSQQKLKESEEKWKALSENSPTHITLLDKEHKILFINHPVPDLSKEELIGTPVYNFVPQEFHQITRDSLNSVWETGEPATYSTNYITKEGDTRFFDVWVGPVFQSDKVVALVAHSMDITDRKKKEEEIRLQSEIMTNLADGVHLIRVNDGIIVYTNPAFEEMFGYNPGEMIGKDISIVNAPTDKTPEETKEEIIGILLETGKWHGEVLNIKKDGMTFWCYVNVSLFEHPEYGKVIVAVHTDITGRKKAEQKLKESEEKFAKAFHSSPNALAITRMEDGEIINVNEGFVRIYGYSYEELIGKSTLDLNLWVNIDERGKFLKSLRENKRVKELEVQIRTKSGQILTTLFSGEIIRLNNELHLLTIATDITGRKKAENKLKELSKLKSEFLRRASHELKTPLISIKGFSELILSLYGEQLETPIISKLREINDGCERLQNIINNLLKASRLESPELKPKLQKEDLSFLIKFCVHELESLAIRRNQSIKLDIHSELYANIEKEEIHDVLSNLLTNAIKYTPPMGKIEIKTELKKTLWLFR